MERRGRKMKIFYNRPLAFSACVAILSAILFYRLNGIGKQILLICAAVAAVVLTILCIIRRKRIGKYALIGLLCLILTLTAFLSSYCYFDLYSESYGKWVDTPCRVEGVVLRRTQSTTYSSRLEVRVTNWQGSDCRVKAILETDHASALQAGDAFAATVCVFFICFIIVYISAVINR